MLASAIEANCDIILTEDMSDGQVIDGVPGELSVELVGYLFLDRVLAY